jgi:hypothetical protein
MKFAKFLIFINIHLITIVCILSNLSINSYKIKTDKIRNMGQSEFKTFANTKIKDKSSNLGKVAASSQVRVEFKKYGFEFKKYSVQKGMFSKFYSKKSNNPKVDVIQDSLYRNLNETFVVKDYNEFRTLNRKWDYKILDKQLEEIFGTLLFRQEDSMTTNGVRNYMEIFVNQYAKCDIHQDNVLDLSEFTSCIQSDAYLSTFAPPPPEYATSSGHTTPAYFYASLFNILDEKSDGYINFVSYMRLRLLAFSWRQCSVNAPYLEETDFECALEYVSGFKTNSRNLSRNIFKLALELSNNPSIRTLDFISYAIIASSVRLFSRINVKEDNDITRSEFNVALDDNNLPLRYNQEIINQFFELLDDHDRPNQGIDLESFIYYDFILQLYTFTGKVRPYYLNINDFKKVISDTLFPNKTLNEILMIPQYNLTDSSYQMYQYLNISQYIGESDYFYKNFLEVKTEVKSETEKKSKIGERKLNLLSSTENKNYPINPLFKNNTNAYRIKVSLNNTLGLIFNTLDSDLDGYISFYDFGVFMQIAHIFSQKDEFNKGKLTAGKLYELIKNYADYPMISFRMRERAEKFNLFDQNLYIDLLSCIQILKIDDIAKYFMRKVDNDNLYEVEIKKILQRVNMQYVPDSHLHRCLRGLDEKNIPRYDWECSFVQGMNLNLQYFESMNNYKDAQINNIKSLNTVFYNIDPNYE